MADYPDILGAKLDHESKKLKNGDDAFDLLEYLIKKWTLASGRNKEDLPRFIEQETPNATTKIITKILQGANGTIDCIRPENVGSGSSATTESEHKSVADVGSAVGYLFSQIDALAGHPAPLTNPDDTVFSAPDLLSILHMYARHLAAIAATDTGSKVGMSCVLVAGTQIYFGSTIIKQPIKTVVVGPNTTNPNTVGNTSSAADNNKDEAKRKEAELKNNVQAYRYTLLKDTLKETTNDGLPALWPKLEVDIVKYLTDAYIIEAGLLDKKFVPLLDGWDGDKSAPLAMFQCDKTQDDREKWGGRKYFAWLCLQLSRTLIGCSNGTFPLIIQRRKIIEGPTYDTWKEYIIDFLMGKNEKGVPGNAASNRLEEFDQQPEGSQIVGLSPFGLTGESPLEQLANIVKDTQKPKPSLIEDLLGELFSQDRVFNEIGSRIKNNQASKYGHCAETYPVLYFHTLKHMHPLTEGLALIPPEIPKNTKNAFRPPCINCKSLLRILGAPEGYNKYLVNHMKENMVKKAKQLLVEEQKAKDHLEKAEELLKKSEEEAQKAAAEVAGVAVQDTAARNAATRKAVGRKAVAQKAAEDLKGLEEKAQIAVDQKKAAQENEEKDKRTIEHLLEDYLVGLKTDWSSP